MRYAYLGGRIQDYLRSLEDQAFGIEVMLEDFYYLDRLSEQDRGRQQDAVPEQDNLSRFMELVQEIEDGDGKKQDDFTTNLLNQMEEKGLVQKEASDPKEDQSKPSDAEKTVESTTTFGFDNQVLIENGIDPVVLQELPEDLRNEMLAPLR